MGDFGEASDQIRDMASALSFQAQTPGGRQSTAGGSRPRNTAPSDDSPPTFSSSASMSPSLLAPQTSPSPARRVVSFSTVSASAVQDFPYSPPRRPTRFVDEHNVIVSQSLPAAEKDVDDPNSPEFATSSNDRREYSTHSALSRLFASEVTTPTTESRALSYQPNPTCKHSASSFQIIDC